MTTELRIAETVRSWSTAERHLALKAIVAEMVPADGSGYFVDDVGFVVPGADPTGSLILDDSTPYLREIRQRVESPEDSIFIMELDVPDLEALTDPK